ncbi:secondary thiamine-phosphate synthase enzyme YjbQ [Haloferax sp. Q22]|uniref:secondary thiamine-phosphate synthase enzyme YjbQ n=1 Tax=Haloferax sp. (strain Q22) TaxID=1526048 RepID=UPI000737B8BA|nr:secondary thiamine-phosphate synthase enzyme YjbQ [Haloferax sp. Q22]
MEIQTESFSIESHSRFEILSVTPEVEATIEDLGVTDGLVYVSTPHTSAALSTNEYEEKLLDDMIDKFKEIAPPDEGYYHDLDHITAGEQPNAHAHLISAMIKRPVLLVLRDGELDLGTWEEVMFFELCGPRERTVTTTILQ